MYFTKPGRRQNKQYFYNLCEWIVHCAIDSLWEWMENCTWIGCLCTQILTHFVILCTVTFCEAEFTVFVNKLTFRNRNCSFFVNINSNLFAHKNSLPPSPGLWSNSIICYNCRLNVLDTHWVIFIFLCFMYKYTVQCSCFFIYYWHVFVLW